jgi:diguanylate cyclase (GGDEF)-like protein
MLHERGAPEVSTTRSAGGADAPAAPARGASGGTRLMLMRAIAAFAVRRSRLPPGSRTADAAAARHADGTARRLARQSKALAALAEIDRAILSRARTDQLIESVLRNAPAVIACDILAITVLPTDIEPQSRTYLKSAGGETVEHRPDCDAQTLRRLAAEPRGLCLDVPGDDALAAPLAQRGAQRILLLPVFVEAHLTAVIAAGFMSSALPADEQRTYTRDFADRLGVAFTAGLHRESRYLEGHFDSLTALPNRRFLSERLLAEISRSQREGLRLALVFINLDAFKKVNDCAGYAAGDAVLREAAARLKQSLREQDILARFGADEFVALLPAIPASINAAKVAEKLSSVLAERYLVAGEEYDLGASIGVSIYPDDGQDATRLLHCADVAMSRGKANGRGQVMFFEERINAEVLSRAAFERDLKHAVRQNQLTVVYQPLINLSDGSMVGAEALVRWQHPQRGLVLPGDFIPIAEQSVLIEHIGDYVRQTVCKQYDAWLARGLAPTRISLNVSTREIARPDFAERIESLLREAEMRPFCLELEITESMLVDTSSRALATLKYLHDRGVRIAIDDFGTGYSSLSYLSRLPFDVLKIDRAFVKDIGRSDEADSIVGAIIAMAHSLGKEIVAEGVETEQQRRVLAEKGVEVGQGYLWSKATTPEHYAELSSAWAPGRRIFPLT